MPEDDYAVVVGISQYPGFGEPPLEASENDARSVVAWLTDPAGGNVPVANVRTVCTSDFAKEPTAATGEPEATRVRRIFQEFYQIAVANSAAGRGEQVGRRLYLYLSGHGFSPGQDLGALYAANATSNDPLNTNASGWLNWFRDNGYFKEFVLWMDCCMDRDFSVSAEPVFRSTGTLLPAGPTFVAFAAKRPLRTVERPIAADRNAVHGVFTWTLLQGLRGGATDESGRITGRSLSDYLINGTKSYLTPADLENFIISKEPDVPLAPPELVFATGRTRQDYPVILHFPAGCANQTANLWGGAAPPAAEALVIPAGETLEHRLQIGLYVVEVPAMHLRQGFEVTATEGITVQVTESGSPVLPAPAEATFILSVDPRQPAAQIILVNNLLGKESQYNRLLTTALPFGLYKVKVRIGRALSESIFLLDRDTNLQTAGFFASGPAGDTPAGPAANLVMAQPMMASAAPLPGTSLTHEYHVDASMSWERLDPQTSGGTPALVPTGTRGWAAFAEPETSEIRIMARVWSGRTATARNVRPWKRTRLLDARGKIRSRLADLPTQSEQGDPFVVQRLAVEPGAFFLRHRMDNGREFECSLPIPPGWAVQAYLLAVADEGEGSTPDTPRQPLALNRYTFLMSRPGAGSDAEMDAVIEAARIALADGRRILNDELEELLLRKYQNPLAGILGAHLILMEEEDRPPSAPSRLPLLDEVVTNLRALVGDDHPDVEALSLRCPSEDLRTEKPFRVPPIFERSWRLMLAASETRPRLLPARLWNRVHASINLSGYLLWSSDRASKNAHAQQLVRWVRKVAGEVAPSTPTPAGAGGLEALGSGGGLPVAMATGALAPDGGAGDFASPPLPPSLGKESLDDLARQLQVPPSVFAALWENAQQASPP